jgi:glycosyltransferase involved in cell wall biosynthesis
MQPTIAHVRNTFLPVSETFIYQFIKASRETSPVAYCGARFHEEVFPLREVVCVGYPGRFAPQKLLTALLRVSRIKPYANSMNARYAAAFRRHRPDLVHAHFGVEGVQVPRDPVYRAAYGRLFQVAARLIALSEDFRSRLIALGCPAEKIAVVHLGVDPFAFSYCPPAPDATRPVHFFATARMVEKKGTRYTLEALAQVRRTHPEIRYTHIGGGPMEAELNALAAQLGIADICDFQGAQPNPVVRAEMRAADIFVLPSVTAANGDEEGTPVTLYEAMATGLPILSTRHSGIPEVVRDGENGYLAPERDSASLAANMIHMIENPHQWAGMAERGRALIEERYDVYKETARLEHIYQETLHQNH